MHKRPQRPANSLADIFHNEVTAWFVLGVSLFITALGWKIADSYAQQRARDRFQFEVEDAQERILKRMLEYEQVLRGGIALFRSIDHRIKRDEWHQYVSTLQIQDYYPGIQGIGFARMLKPEELQSHIEEIRSEGFPSYTVRPQGPRDTYSSIVFLEPFDWRNQRAFGYDMFSNPIRRAAMEQARDSGQPAVSGRVILVQETDKDIQAGFLMYLPLYRKGMPTDTVEQRREALLGFVYSPFRVHDLMNGILGKTNPYLDFSLYDGTGEQIPETLLYNSGKEQPDSDPLYQSKYNTTTIIALPGRNWTAQFRTRRSFDQAMSTSQPMIIAFGGIVVDILLFIVIWSLAGERTRVQRKADKITEELRVGTQRLQLAQEATRSGIWELDLTSNRLHWDERMHSLYGIPPDEFDHDYRTWEKAVHPDDRKKTLHLLQQAIAHNKDFKAQFRILRPGGETVYIESNAVIQHDRHGNAYRITGINRDITEEKQVEERLRLAASVFDHAHEGIAITDVDTRIIEVNPTFTSITGYSREEVIGQTPAILKSGRHGPDFYTEMWQTLQREGFWRGEIWNRRKDGESFAELLTISTVFDGDNNPSHYVGVFSDITRIKEQQSRLEHLAKFDPLTQLPNRVLFADRMQQAMAQARRSDTLLAVCYLDLDNFKPVNDRLGHHTGDELLVEVAMRLQATLRDSDSAARLGGDEFALLLTQLDSVSECHQVLDRILQALSQPYHLNNEQLFNISASIGVTLYPNDNVDSDTLIRHADQAMYIAKQSGRNRFHLFDAEFDRLTQAHIEEVNQIGRALKEGQLVLHYQPKVDMRRGEVIGMEALIRWQHPERGLLPPGEFLPLIENSALSVELGEWVLQQALEQLRRWLSEGMRLSISVNISGYHIQQPQFTERLKKLLEQYPDLDSNLLELEVLETTALEDIMLVSDVMDACRKLGILFSLDDFGTGYSSLTYLKRLPAETLKIDQTFVRDMLEDPEDLAIIEGIIGLSHAFHRQVIAEGVESLEHGALLLRMGCDLGQGYGISRPMPADEVPAWVQGFEQPQSWTNACKIDWSHNDLPLLSAEIEHRRWVDDLIASITAGTSVVTPPQLHNDKCHFSKWYNGIGRNHYGHLPEFQAIDPIHKEVHRLGQKMVDLDRNGHNDEALQHIPELRALRNRIQEYLLRLKTAVVTEVLKN